MKYIHRKLLLLVVLFFGLQTTHSQNVWDGDNAIGEFIFCNNWVSNTCPTTWSSTTDLLFNVKNSGSQTTMYFNYGMWKDCNNIIYQATYLAGLPFDADGPTGSENGLNFYGKIENLSPNFTHTFNTIPLHGRNATIIELNPVNGGLTFNRPIYNSGNRNFNVWGNNGKKLTLNSYLEGNASVGLYIKEYSIVEVNYNNAASLSGGYFVENGELWVNSNGVIQGGIQVGNGNANTTKLYISHVSTATTVANNINVPANSTNAYIGALNTTNTHNYTGTINLNNNNVNFDVVSAGGNVNFSGVISGTGGIQKINPGLIRLSASNTYTGNTTINAGTLQYSVANAISNSSNVILNGGKYSTGATTGYSDTVGTLALTENSTIELGTGTHALNFAASNAVAWTAAKVLTITGWTNSCTGAKVFVGNSSTGLTTAQLAQVTFQGYPAGAKITTTGELVPNNVMLTATGGTLLGSYTTLSAAFAAINASTHTGVIAISILNDIDEGTGSATLNNNAAVTSVLIEPGGCGARTIFGNTTAGNPLININGADNVTIDGLNTGGYSLTISNTNNSATSGTSTIRFQADAINNLVTNCSVLGSSSMAANIAGGNIWFAASSAITGNDTNTISNCNIGPAGVNLPTKGIYFTGTGGFENSGIIINNNNIYDYFSATVESAGIYLTTGSTLVNITNNRFYQTATRTQTVAFQHSGIKIANASGNGYNVTGNTIGYSSSAGTGNYAFVGIASSLFYPINLSVGATTATSVQNNTIAGITCSTSATTTVNLFTAINITGGGIVNIGNTTGNLIGLPAAPIILSATSAVAGAGANAYGINMIGSSAIAIQNNTIQSISTTGAATASINFTGINVAGAANYTLTNNTIGHAVEANSIILGTLGTTTGSSLFTGISSSASADIIIGGSGTPNTIQNIVFNAVATNSFTGFLTSGVNTTTTVSYNVVKGIKFAAASTTSSSFRGVSNTGGITGTLTINNNSLGITGNNLVTYTAACSGALRTISNTGGTATTTLNISSNDITGITHATAASASHEYIYNTATSLSQNINSNTFTNLNVNTSGAITFISNTSTLAANGTKNVNSNRIVGTFVKASGGNLSIYTDAGSSPTSATINNSNNDFSNITVAGASRILGWNNTDGGANSPTKTITGNTFTYWTLDTGDGTGITVNSMGGTTSVSSNTITNFTGANALTGISIGAAGNATTLNVNSNTINALASSSVSAVSVLGITNAQPNTTLTNNTSSNTITNLTNVGGTITAINNTAASPTKSMTSNTINNLTTGANLIYGIYSSTGGNVSITNNAISSLTSNHNAGLYGIYAITIATSGTITGNTINNLVNNNTGTSAIVRGIHAGDTVPLNISSNMINSISGPSTYTNALNSALVGIYCNSSNAASTINGNTIYDINATSTGAIPVSVAGINTASTASGGNIAKNKIYGLTNTTTATNSATIGLFPNGGSWTFANNMISIINNNTVQAIGVYDLGATGARKYYYNSINIGGSHGGAQNSYALQFSAAAGSVDIKNNIFNVTRSGGKNYAIVNLGTFGSFVCNYNVLNCSNTSTIGYTGADRTFAAWKSVSGGDNNSFTNVILIFANASIADLHIVGGCSEAESGGTPISITDDFDATTRNVSTPDIGADEYTGTMPAAIVIADTAICAGSSTVLTATSSDLTYAYTWSPTTALSPTSGATVTASPATTITYTVTGTSPSGCIKNKDVTVTVNTLPPAITVSPASVNVCANSIQTFTASPVTNSSFTLGTRTGISLTATTPYKQSILVSSDNRIQYLVTKAELNSLGIMSAGKIKSIGFNVEVVGVGAMPLYTISMANTTDTVLTSNYISTGFTTVYSTTNLLPVSGLNTHTFSTPFDWDGTSNIVINICHTSSGGGTASGVSVYTLASAMTNDRSGTASCAAAASIAGTNVIRPVITFEFENPITWSPITDLYTNALATTIYAANTNFATVYSKTAAPIVYTATVTNPGSGCFRTTTATITMNNSVWDGVSWSPSTPTGNTGLEFTGDYTSSSNLSGCSCTVTSGHVVFNSPATLTIVNGLTVGSGPAATLTFNDDASLLQTNDAATNSGIVTIERATQPMYRFDYTYWGSPVTLASNFRLGGVGGLSPDTLSDKYFSWTPTVASGPGIWSPESASTVMDPIKGYITRAPQYFSFSPATKVAFLAYFIGTPNNGVISSPIYHGSLGIGLNNDKYNLLGNPYPSALDAQAFLTDPANTPIIDGTIYFWTHNSAISTSYVDPFYGDYVLNYNNNDYASWNSLGAVGSRGSAALSGGVVPNGFIASGQGFFTKSTGTAASGATVTFKNSMRVAGNNNVFFRNSNIAPNGTTRNREDLGTDKSRIWLNLISNGGVFNQILVGYVPDATLGWDRSYDGVRMEDSNGGTSLYSIIPDRKLVIQGRPTFTTDDQVALGYTATIADTFTFRLDHFDESFENQAVYIEDKDLNIIHNLKQSPYVFTTASGTFDNRFVLRYTDNALQTVDFNANQNVSAIVFNHDLLVESTENINEITIYDVSGKLIQTYVPQESNKKFRTGFHFANGVYLAKIKLENGAITTKKLIN